MRTLTCLTALLTLTTLWMGSATALADTRVVDAKWFETHVSEQMDPLWRGSDLVIVMDEDARLTGDATYVRRDRRGTIIAEISIDGSRDLHTIVAAMRTAEPIWSNTIVRAIDGQLHAGSVTVIIGNDVVHAIDQAAEQSNSWSSGDITIINPNSRMPTTMRASFGPKPLR